ncbi:hypothetical protein AT6N2_C1997 [Agrobacterium tumefaciens]|nr:hypothetical protein AT6N2_C1997 [Agrobacterium tumefaciens]
MSGRALLHLEPLHQLEKRLDLTRQDHAGRARLFGKRRVLLRHLVHLVDGAVDVVKCGGLILRCRRDGFDMLADGDDLLTDGGKYRARLLHQLRTGTDFMGGLVDELLDLAGRIRRALRKLAHFLRHDGKALASLAGPCRLDTGVQGKEVGLEGDIVNDFDDLFDLARRILDAPHGIDSVADDRAGAVGTLLGHADSLVGFTSPLGRGPDRGGDLVDGSRCLFQRGGLVFSPLRQIDRGLFDFETAVLDDERALADLPQRIAQVEQGLVEIRAQTIEPAGKGRVDGAAEIATRQPAKTRRDLTDGELDLAVHFLLFGVVAVPFGLRSGAFFRALAFDRQFLKCILAEDDQGASDVAEFVGVGGVRDRRIEIAVRKRLDRRGELAQRLKRTPDDKISEQSNAEHGQRTAEQHHVAQAVNLGVVNIHGNADEKNADRCACLVGDRHVARHVTDAEQRRRAEIGFTLGDFFERRMIGRKLGARRSLTLLIFEVGGQANELATLGFKNGGNPAVSGCGAVHEVIVAHRSDAGAADALEVAIHHFESNAANLHLIEDRHVAHRAVRVTQRGGDDVVLQADIGRKTNCRHAERDQADRQCNDLTRHGPEYPIVHETVPPKLNLRKF